MMTLRRLDRFLAGVFDPDDEAEILDRLRKVPAERVVTYGLIKRMCEAFFDGDRTVFTADDQNEIILIHKGIPCSIKQASCGVPFIIDAGVNERPIHNPLIFVELLWDVCDMIILAENSDWTDVYD